AAWQRALSNIARAANPNRRTSIARPCCRALAPAEARADIRLDIRRQYAGDNRFHALAWKVPFCLRGAFHYHGRAPWTWPFPFPVTEYLNGNRPEYAFAPATRCADQRRA